MRAVALGDVERHSSVKKTINLAYWPGRAVLSLDEHGQRKTWLLTGWEEGKPDAAGEVRTRSGAMQNAPTFSRDELGAGLEALRPDENISKVVDAEGKPLRLYRGVYGHKAIPDGALEGQARPGYATFLSNDPVVSASYATPDDGPFSDAAVDATVPLYVKVDKLIEFPVNRSGRGLSFDKFEFDRQAQRFTAG